MQRVFLTGAARLAVLGGGAELRHFAGNRFELRCKIEPSELTEVKNAHYGAFFVFFKT